MKNTSLLLVTALATALAALPAPMPAEAATDTTLLRCRSPDGTIGYTDRSCAVFGAQAVPIDAELVARITRDAREHASMDGSDGSEIAAVDTGSFDMGSATLATAAPGRRSPAGGCARTPTQLATDLHASVALGDVNRIAESYHFAGMSSAAGERVLDRLQGLAGHPVVDSRYYGASIGEASHAMDGSGVATSADDAPGMVQLVLGSAEGGDASVEFDVHHYAGCYFVSFAGASFA